MGDETPAPGDFRRGERIAGYRVDEVLGRGGMAVVYRAYDERLGRNVALKLLALRFAHDEAFRQRFSRESRAAAAIDHPNIIPIFEAGEADGALFIAMRFVQGGDVLTIIQERGPLPAAQACGVVTQVAAALDAAHSHGLVHRDVKPANMLREASPGDGQPDHIYLSDFGLSKHWLSSSHLTAYGELLGTMDYISPEQLEGRPADGQSDQYALACSAFEMLTGAPPFPQDETMAIMRAQVSTAPPALTSRCPGLPPEADQVMAKALAKDPAGRYRTCLEFASALRHSCAPGHGPAVGTPPAREATQAVSRADLMAAGVIAEAPSAAGSDSPASEPPAAATAVPVPGISGREAVVGQHPAGYEPTQMMSGAGLPEAAVFAGAVAPVGEPPTSQLPAPPPAAAAPPPAVTGPPPFPPSTVSVPAVPPGESTQLIAPAEPAAELRPAEPQPGGTASAGSGPAWPGPPSPPKRRRRLSRKARVAIIIPLVLLAVLAGVDRLAATYAANQIATRIQKYGFPVKPGVTVEGFPFLTQVITRHLVGVDISAPNFPVGPVTASMQVHATGIALDSGYESGSIAHVTGTGLITFSSLSRLAGVEGAPGLEISKAGSHKVKLTANLQVLTATAVARVKKTGRDKFSIRVVSADGIPASLLGPIRHLVVRIPELPQGLAVQTVGVTVQGVVVQVAGSHVRFGNRSHS